MCYAEEHELSTSTDQLRSPSAPHPCCPCALQRSCFPAQQPRSFSALQPLTPLPPQLLSPDPCPCSFKDARDSHPLIPKGDEHVYPKLNVLSSPPQALSPIAPETMSTSVRQILCPQSRCPFMALCSKLLLILLTLSPSACCSPCATVVQPMNPSTLSYSQRLSSSAPEPPSLSAPERLRALNLAYTLPPIPQTLKSKFLRPSTHMVPSSNDHSSRCSLSRRTLTGPQLKRPFGRAARMQGVAGVRMDSGYEGQIFEETEGQLATSHDDILVLGLSHKTAPVELREKLAVPQNRWTEFGAKIQGLNSVKEAAVLSTCNRFEVYLVAPDIHSALREVLHFLSKHSNVNAGELQQHMLTLRAEHGVRHVFQVAAGLDSLVVGEGQILAQIKKCHELSSGPRGPAGKVLSRMLTTAISAGKRVRTETDISKGSVSVSSAAIELVERKCFGDLDLSMQNSRVAVVGAGKMGRLLVQHLLPRRVKCITLVNRNLEKAEELLKGLGIEEQAQVKGIDQMLEAIESSDIIFTSTGAPEPILHESNLQGRVKSRKVFVDISVPRNIDESVKHLDLARTYNVDDLKVLVASNHAKRRKLVEQAEVILAEEFENFEIWKLSLGTIPMITALQDKAEAIRTAELEKSLSKLSGLTPAERATVERLTKGIVNKLLHGPMNHLRTVDDLEERTHTVKSVAKMFLKEDTTSGRTKKNGKKRKNRKK